MAHFGRRVILSTVLVAALMPASAQVVPREPETVQDAVAALTKTLGHDDFRMRRNAAWSLGHFGPEARPAVPALVRLLGDPEASVRQVAAETLGRIGPAAIAARPAIESALRSEVNVGVRAALEGAIRAIAGQ